MNNFRFQNPTRLLFGKGMVRELSRELPQGAKILLTFGGGSVKKNGVYDAVVEALKGFEVTEFWGIESNPDVSTLRKAIELGREKGINFILAVGGGSVIDGSKLVALGIHDKRDAWQIVLEGADLNAPKVPFGTVLTIPATGSEMNQGAVISNRETGEKFGVYGKHPVFSVLDPTYTFTLPPYQVACGIADSFIHVVEQYMTRTGESYLMDRWAEGILETLIHRAARIHNEPEDYDLRADFELAATMALNGFISMGVTQDWATHMIGHELTALTGLTHGHTLAIIYPALLRVVGYTKKRGKLLQYAERVWGITEGSEEERIAQAIDKTEEFFQSLGLATRFATQGILEEVKQSIVERFRERGMRAGEDRDIDYLVVDAILKEA